MRKFKLLSCFLLPVILYIAPYVSRGQGATSLSKAHKIQTIPLEEVIKKISNVFKTQFIYEKSLLEGKLIIYKDELVKDKSIEEVLKSILYPNGLVFLYVKENYYTIIAKERLYENERDYKGSSEISYSSLPIPADTGPDQIRDQIIKGRVTDVTGKALPGVSVAIKGTSSGTTTDGEGRFSIHAPDANMVLLFSYIGFTTQEIPVNGRNNVNVRLVSTDNQLQTVVVSALGVVKSTKSITYATQSISGDEVIRVQDPNFMNSLAGKAAGVVITKGGSGPGSSSRIILRGNKSIMGHNSPLYVIEGVPMNNVTGKQTSSLYGAFDGGDAISNINPEDIQSIQILQGASAAALYGSQAANGVILVTTKKGRKGVAKIDFSSTAIFENAIGLPQLQTTYGQSDPALNDSWGPKITNGSDKHLKEFFRTGKNLINAVSVSNGNDLAQFYLSYANSQISGIVPENHLTKHNITIRATTQLLDNRLTLDGSVNYINQKVYNRPQAGFNFSPILPLYSFPTGDDWSKYSGNNFEVWDPLRQMYVQNWPYIRNETLNSQNPYWIQKRDQNDLFRDRTISSFTAKYKIADGLNIQARTTYDRVEDSYEQRVSASTDPIESGINGGYATSKSVTNQLYSDLLLIGNKQVSEDVSLSGTLGVSSTQNDYSNISLSSTLATSLSYPNYFSVYALNGQFNKSESKTRISNQAAFGNLTFGYKEKLFLDITRRNEWSSTVAQSFFYPSLGLSYILTNNGGSTGVLSFAKLRGSYAQVGNSLPFGVASPAPPYSLDNAGNINGRNALPFFNGTDSFNLRPERTKSYEFGADLRFFHDKLTLNLTYYNATTYDQVFQIQAPAGSGAANFWINGGTILNKGLEAILSYNTSLGKTKWTSTVTFSQNKNQIRELSSLLKADRFVLTDYNSTRLVALFLTRPVNGKYGSYGDMFGKIYQKYAKGNLLIDSTGMPLFYTDANQTIGHANPNF